VSPEQITEALDEIVSNIADAHILIRRLGREMASVPSSDLDVVYGDIWADAGLAGMEKSLRLMESQLVRAQNITLPEHFERLRTGVA
jgi:hypothetical protein